MKKVFCLLLSCLLLNVPAAASGPSTDAAAAVLMDADSGRVLYACDPHEPRPIASVTKLMTALVALESGHSPEEQVEIREEWTGIEGSSLYLKPGERLKLETLLYGLLLRSGNDAAQAVAAHCGGSVEAFVEGMNEKAEQLGMENTHFVNPSGLDEEGHCSSAYDLALLARACLSCAPLMEMTSTRTVTLEGRYLTNHNKLLWRYEGCLGMKTGYTEKAGRTLVSAARREGMTLICVTLSDPNDWRDHAALYDHGFSAFQRRCIVCKGDILATVPVEGSLIPMWVLRADESLFCAMRDGEEPRLSYEWKTRGLSAPVKEGSVSGQAVYTVGEDTCLRIPLIISRDIPLDLAEPAGGLWGLLKG